MRGSRPSQVTESELYVPQTHVTTLSLVPSTSQVRKPCLVRRGGQVEVGLNNTTPSIAREEGRRVS